MGLRERVYRRFLKELRRAGVKRDDVIVVPVDATVQSYATLRILRDVEEGYETVLRAFVVEDLPECFGDVLEGYEVVRVGFGGLREALEGLECGDALVVVPWVAEDAALSVLEGAVGMDWSFYRLGLRCRVAYPLVGTLLGEILRLCGGCGSVRGGSEWGAELLGRLEGRVAATALSRVFMRVYGVVTG